MGPNPYHRNPKWSIFYKNKNISDNRHKQGTTILESHYVSYIIVNLILQTTTTVRNTHIMGTHPTNFDILILLADVYYTNIHLRTSKEKSIDVHKVYSTNIHPHKLWPSIFNFFYRQKKYI